MSKIVLNLFLQSFKALKSLIFLCMLLILNACASSNEIKYIDMGNLDQNSKASPAAYAADAMHLQPLMESHADWKPQRFFYKTCEEIGEKAYYSKTYYECD